MSTLPVEILHSVFIQLHLKQKLECTLVCRQWARLLRSQSLFHTVEIASPHLYNDFMDMMERIPARAQQVEVLRIFDCVPIGYDKRKYLNVFPNVRIIELKGDYTFELSKFRHKPVEFVQSKSKITQLVDYDECEIALELISSQMCSKLVYLKLNINFLKNMKIDFIGSLTNLPVLKDLSLDYLEISLYDLELLHRNIPSMEKLCITRCVFYAHRIPNDVQPTGVKNLKIKTKDYEPNMERVIMWLQYICEKYTALEDLNFSVCNIIENDYEEMPSFYYDGILPIAKARGAQLKSLPVFRVMEDMPVFKRLDEYGCRLNKCKILAETCFIHPDKIADSDQAKYIQILHLQRIERNSLHWLGRFESLKELKLGYFYVDPEEFSIEERAISTLHLNDLLVNCSNTLEKLIIQQAYLVLSPTIILVSNVKELDFHNVDLPNGADLCLAKHFPNLRSLRLSHCLFSNQKFFLPEHHLSRLDISNFKDDPDPFRLNIMLKTKAKSRFYTDNSLTAYSNRASFSHTTKTFEHLDFRVALPEGFDTSMDFLKIVCASVRNFIVCGYELV